MKVGIIGAGLMGSGIAQVAAAAGHQVALTDIELVRADAGKAVAGKNLGRQVAKGAMDEAAADAILARIATSAGIDALLDADIVIEAATENPELKKKIFAGLAGKLREDALLATNTSSISITMLGTATDRPAQFVGLHFFNPVPVMKLVEVIPSLATSAQARDAAKSFAEGLGKTVIISEDSPSFIVNRILCPMLNEAIFALGEGIGSIEDIDTGMRLGAGHPMGPLTLCDFVGLDTLKAVMDVMLDATGDPKYRAAPLLVKYVEAGWLGKKAGRGFYDYSGDKPVPTR